MITSAEFEKRVERIHRLLEAEDSVVTWDDRIPDPDRPGQARQIDVTIRRGGKLTIVECRIHKEPQDVTWIEELIGRRASLRADTVIAVSSSGFTEGAETKADKFGIILRHFNTLTEEEVRNWGKQRSVDLVFYKFTDTTITFHLPDVPTLPISITDDRTHPVAWRSLFEQLVRSFTDENRFGRDTTPVDIEANFDAPVLISGQRANSIFVETTIKRVIQKLDLVSVVAYADPLTLVDQPLATVGKFNLSSFEIVEASDYVTIVVDLTGLDVPSNSLFSTILFDFGRIVEVRGVRFIGQKDAMLFNKMISFRFQGGG